MPAEDSPAGLRTRTLQTANEFVSLDEIDGASGAVGSLSFAHEAARGIIALTAYPDPFLALSLEIDGQRVPLNNLQWQRPGTWIPRFSAETPGAVVECAYLTPPAKRGASVRTELRAARSLHAKLSFTIRWRSTQHTTAIAREMSGHRTAALLAPGEACALSFSLAWPLFSIGLAASADCEWSQTPGGPSQSGAVEVPSGETLELTVSRAGELQADETLALELHTGIGTESASSAACAMDLLDQGWDALLRGSQAFLDARAIHCAGAAEPLEDILRANAAYNFFYSRATAVDTERSVAVSSRSPRSGFAASYRDRDVCLYSLPSVLLVDPSEARHMLDYVFGVQMSNIGARSRSLDGVLLEPGFSLDGLVSPIRALWMYVDLTDDLTVLFDQKVQTGLNRILEMLESAAHPKIALYRTRLTPGERISPVEYLTYSNILVWRSLVDLSDLYRRIRDVERSAETDLWSRDVQAAIMQHLVIRQEGGPMFCWGSDLDGRMELGDEPEGSLELAAHLEFCRPTLPAFANTVAYLRAARTANPPEQISTLTLANRLLSGDLGPLEFLKSAPLDGGVASGTLDAHGHPQSERAWAACAGYLSYALVRALEAHVEPPVLRPRPAVRGRISRSTLRPGIGWI